MKDGYKVRFNVVNFEDGQIRENDSREQKFDKETFNLPIIPREGDYVNLKGGDEGRESFGAFKVTGVYINMADAVDGVVASVTVSTV